MLDNAQKCFEEEHKISQVYCDTLICNLVLGGLRHLLHAVSFVHCTLSKKTTLNSCPQLSQILTDFQNSFTDTHTHPFNGPLSGTTWVSRYHKGKTNLDFTEARDTSV